MHDFVDFSAALCRHEAQFCGEKLPAPVSHPRIAEYLPVSHQLSVPKPAICSKLHQTNSSNKVTPVC